MIPAISSPINPLSPDMPTLSKPPMTWETTEVVVTCTPPIGKDEYVVVRLPDLAVVEVRA